MRAPRARLRRRRPLRRKRAARLAHLQHTHSQYTLPELGTKRASKATRDGVAERCSAPAVPKSVAGERALMGDEDQVLRDVELPSVQPAKQHDAWQRGRTASPHAHEHRGAWP